VCIQGEATLCHYLRTCVSINRRFPGRDWHGFTPVFSCLTTLILHRETCHIKLITYYNPNYILYSPWLQCSLLISYSTCFCLEVMKMKQTPFHRPITTQPFQSNAYRFNVTASGHSHVVRCLEVEEQNVQVSSQYKQQREEEDTYNCSKVTLMMLTRIIT